MSADIYDLLKIAAEELIAQNTELKSELAEAREALSEWENAALHVEEDHPDEKHCGCVPVLRKLLHDARSDRDELRGLEAMYQKVVAACLRCDPIPACQREDDQLEPPLEVIDRIRCERDEAREGINSIRMTLSKNGEAVGNGEIDFSIIEMIQNLIQTKDYFIRKSDLLERELAEARGAVKYWEELCKKLSPY